MLMKNMMMMKPNTLQSRQRSLKVGLTHPLVLYLQNFVFNDMINDGDGDQEDGDVEDDDRQAEDTNREEM